MGLSNLKYEILEMIKLSGEISKFNQMLLHHSDMNDKRNFNTDKCNRIKIKVSKLQERFYFLHDKWLT